MTLAVDPGRLFTRVMLAAAACLITVPLAAGQSREGSFERTLRVAGPVELSIRAGSGSIRVQPGAGDTVRVAARLRAGGFLFSGDATERIREIERNPPIEQAGNVVRVGWFQDERLPRDISISYDVTVPSQTTLNARTGSGAIEVGDLRGPVEASTGSGRVSIGRIEGPVVASTGSGGVEVAGAASLDAHSGSGSIRAAAIAGPAKARTGSGSLRVTQSGRGDLDLSSSSGDVTVDGADGAARVSASSGSITVEGRPTGPWSIHSSSGGVTLRLPPDAAFDLDAQASSGGVESAHPVTMTGRVDRRRLQGKVRGGGALVEVRSSSGGIRIQ